MSRIQRILDKAEREGVLHRTRPMVNPAAPGSNGATALEELEVPRAPAAAAPVEVPHASPAKLFPAARAIRSTVLDSYLVAATQGTGIAAEQYRALRTRIMQTSHGGAAHTVLITSPGRGEGKSLTAANLALTMAQDYQRRICVVDADFRAPQQHRLFGLAETPGLSDVLLGRSPLEEALVDDRGAWADGVASRTAAGSPGRASRDLCDATDAGHAEVSLRPRRDRCACGGTAGGRRRSDAAGRPCAADRAGRHHVEAGHSRGRGRHRSGQMSRARPERSDVGGRATSCRCSTATSRDAA